MVSFKYIAHIQRLLLQYNTHFNGFKDKICIYVNVLHLECSDTLSLVYILVKPILE